MAVAPPLGVAILLGGQATWPRTLAALAAILVVWLAVGAVGWTRGDWRSLLKKQDPTSGGELP